MWERSGMYFFSNLQVPFCLQSTCKPLNYCMAVELHGKEKVAGENSDIDYIRDFMAHSSIL